MCGSLDARVRERMPLMRHARRAGPALLGVLIGLSALARPVTSQGPGARSGAVRPTADSIRRIMAIPSRADVRGRIDSTAYTARPEQMAAVWERASHAPAPDSLAPVPPAGVAA